MDDEDDGRIQSLEQLVEELRTGYNELLEQTEKTVDRFENENAELKREIASLKEKLENKDSEEEEEDESGEPDFPEAEDTEDPKNVDPDAYTTGANGSEVSPTRKSIEWAPDLHATVQLNEFDDAPSVGNLSIKRNGKKLLLTDPDGTSGQRKWMVPLRRETSEAIELKWAQLGEGSDSDSDSDSDWDVKTDTAVADESAANTQNRSIEERVGDDALQIRGFDEQSPGGSPLRKIELKLVTTTGTGGGTFLVLVDPDGNEVPGTKWTIPLREAGTGGGREIKWAAFGGKVDFSGGASSVSTDTEQDPGNPPGESVEHYHATGETGGPLQIRGFQQDAAKALRYPGVGHTSGITLANAEVIVRDTTSRKRTEYVPASTFWLQGANADQNYAPSIKLGNANGYITISTTS